MDKGTSTFCPLAHSSSFFPPSEIQGAHRTFKDHEAAVLGVKKFQGEGRKDKKEKVGQRQNEDREIFMRKAGSICLFRVKARRLSVTKKGPLFYMSRSYMECAHVVGDDGYSLSRCRSQ